MKIYSADTWTPGELQAQVRDAGRRTLIVPAANSACTLSMTVSTSISDWREISPNGSR